MQIGKDLKFYTLGLFLKVFDLGLFVGSQIMPCKI